MARWRTPDREPKAVPSWLLGDWGERQQEAVARLARLGISSILFLRWLASRKVPPVTSGLDLRPGLRFTAAERAEIDSWQVVDE